MKRLGEITAAATALVAAVLLCLAVRTVSAAGPDASPPTGSVTGFGSPASGTLDLRLYASDAGWGLANAEASLDGTVAFVRLGSGACPEHPSFGGPEPPPGACPESVSSVPLSLDTRAVADGPRELTVRVTDAAANTTTLVDRTIQVRNAPLTGSGPVATVAVGVTSNSPGDSSGGGSLPPSPPTVGQGGCRRPRLKMHLARKPLWHTRPHHVPVLRYGRRYPYKGRLTCLVRGKRVAAPKGTRVGVYYRVWTRSFKHPWGPVKKLRRAILKVRKKGRLRIKLGFRSGRTLIFRYRAPDGELAKAKLRLATPPRTRKPPWGPR